MIHKITCKFCHKPLSVEVDDDYSKAGDPLKLLPMACCNECSDLRERRRVLHGWFAVLINKAILLQPGSKDYEHDREKLRTSVTAAVRAYLRLISSWLMMPPIQFDEGIVEDFITNPRNAGKILGILWKMARNAPRELALT
jgi:hypothetical protein